MENFSQTENFTEALDWYQKMLDNGIKPTTGSYNALITIYGMKKDKEKVLQLCTEMEAIGLRIHSSTFEVLVAALLRCNDLQGAFDQFLRMRKEGIRPTEEMFYSVLYEYAKLGNVDQVYILIKFYFSNLK